ncbi:hypothetical protein DPMN_154282 [Dreissena polymorpha]|uniref:Uncharacterized protein n=1 Tax=Dreissena polymorpha TaxID=45954 RepID=A0A9D4J8Z1_DREPO|nr:hypothetical protein DPMN_154282 [Dreissena polymorpha]
MPAPDSAVKNRSLASAETPTSKNNTFDTVGEIPNTATKNIFWESTPVSILKKRDEAKCHSVRSDKKRKLTFHDNLEAQLAKIPHTDIETNSVDDLLTQTHPVNIKSQDNNPANGIEVNSNVEANIERKSSIGSDTSNVDELIELDTSRDDIVVEETIFWKQHLALKIQDKNEILQNKKLTSYHMEAVNILLRKQFSING